MKRPNQPTDDRTAIALVYDGAGAPRVSAKGSGMLGEQIIKLAAENGVPLHEDAALAAALAGISLGEEIPQELYLAVAEVLAFIYYLETIHSGGAIS
jgi:flagellar biosynthesis protein